METFLEYKARILQFVEGKDPIEVQRATYSELLSLLAGAPAEVLGRRPSPNRWSPVELLAHFAEAEITAFWRYRQMIEHTGCPLPGYDQNLWADLGQYAARPARESLEEFRLLRDSNLRMFDRLTPDQWKCHGVHLERGPMTVHDLATQIAGHDLNHLKQLREILGK